MLSWLKSSKFKECTVALALPSLNRVNLTPEKAKICAAANSGIKYLLYCGQKRKRDQYGKYTDTEQVTIAKYAVVISTPASASHYAKVLSRPINESTVRGYVRKYKHRILKVQNHDDITELQQAKPGKPLFIGEQLDSEVHAHVKNVRESCGVVTWLLLIDAEQGVMRMMWRTLLLKSEDLMCPGYTWNQQKRMETPTQILWTNSGIPSNKRHCTMWDGQWLFNYRRERYAGSHY